MENSKMDTVKEIGGIQKKLKIVKASIKGTHEKNKIMKSRLCKLSIRMKVTLGKHSVLQQKLKTARKIMARKDVRLKTAWEIITKEREEIARLRLELNEETRKRKATEDKVELMLTTFERAMDRMSRTESTGSEDDFRFVEVRQDPCSKEAKCDRSDQQNITEWEGEATQVSTNDTEYYNDNDVLVGSPKLESESDPETERDFS